MNAPVIGMIAGLLLAIAATTGGFGGFLLAVLFGAIGYLVAGQLSGRLDLGSVVRGKNGG